MTTNILNLPDFTVAKIHTQKHDYLIDATYSVEPVCCVQCGVVGKLYGHGTRKQLLMDLPSHGRRVGIEVTRRRYRCGECRKTFLQPIADMHDSGSMTKRLVVHIEEQSLNRTFTSIATDVGVNEKTVRNVFNEYTDFLDRTITFETPEWLGIDELHLLRHPRCIFTNIKEATIVGLLETRNKPEVTKHLFWMPERERVKVVTMDMWRPYKDAVRAALPDAAIIVDKFHVVRMASQALEVLRRGMREDMSTPTRRRLMRSRFLLLRRRSELDAEQLALLAEWIASIPRLGEAYRLKEAFYDIFDLAEKEAARKAYDAWAASVPKDMVTPFKPLTTAMGNWSEEVFAYFDHRATNACTEALNGLAKMVNRNGRGYSFKAIRAKMLFGRYMQKPRPKYGEAWVVPMANDIDVYSRADAPDEPTLGVDIGLLTSKLTTHNDDSTLDTIRFPKPNQPDSTLKSE